MIKSIFLISCSHTLLEELRVYAPPDWRFRLFSQFEPFYSARPDKAAFYVFIDYAVPPKLKCRIITYLYGNPGLPFLYITKNCVAVSPCHPVIRVPWDLPLISSGIERFIRERDFACRKALSCFSGDSPQACLLKRKIQDAADSDLTVLLTGPSGSGKTLAASIIHALSRRAPAPFYSVNAAAIPPQLAEAELFGTEKGAFTDAEKRAGYFGSADGGTLFLDEIGELDLAVQAMLLHVLESGSYRKVGSDKEYRTDIRLIFATNADLKRMVQKKLFREDLYYRISKLSVRFPSLNERKEDIPALCRQYLAAKGKGITSAAVRLLCGMTWQGNIRQLFACLERAAASSDKGLLDISDIKAALTG